MDSSKRGPPKKGFPSRGRAKRLGGHVNNLRESPSNAKHPQSKGRFVSQVNGRGKSPSGIRNQVCGRGALRKRFLPSLCLPTDASLEKNKENKLLPSDLISFLKLQSDEVVVQLLQHYSLVEDLVQSNTNDVMFTLMSVLAHAVNAQFLKEKLYELLNKIFQIRFVNKLCAFTITIKKLYPERAEQFFDNLVLVLEVYCHAMIYSATEKFPSLIDACISVIIALKPGSNCLERYENLQCMVSEALLTFKNVKCEKPNLSNVDKHISLTDFCLMSVYPTNEDLGGYYYPFLQRNITKGKYESNAHYLDVQFKLLREDFMRPLRDGVTACKIDSQSRNMDVYVYRNAKILKPEILKRELIHYVQLELPRMFNVATSKRFMFGNLLCFSCNNFESVIIATVFDVNPDKLTQGILAVKFESNVNLDYSQEYIVLESRAFFVAYKHVLTALKNMSGKELPFAPYIVYVQSDVNHPQYLTDEDKYDLRVLRDNELMNTSDTMLRKTNLNIEIQRFPKLYRGRSSLFAKESYVMPPDYKWSHLQAIEVMQDLELWPSESELGMDNSQRKALRNALTRELVIIQGPPGTGKTFIGLKIAQILLHNHLYPPGPILVVCFTNHALDQFLEGVLSFTRNIVRVGSRSNNEKIQEFQINKLARFRKYQRNIPFLQKLNNLQFEVDELEYMIRSLKVSIKECIERKGILKLQELIAYGIIPHHLQIQLQYYCHGLSGWLLTEQDYSFIYQDYEENEKSIESDEEFFDAVTEVSEHASEEKEIFKDVQELYNFEEQSRKIETYNDIHEGQIQGQSFLSYELTKLELSNKIKVLEKVIADNPEDIFSVVNYYIMKNNLLKLQRGLAVENVPKEIAAIGNMNVNLYELDSLTRWQLYRLWLNILVQILKGRLSQAENEFKLKSQVLKKVMDQEYLHVMKESSVVGMTTTGAAQYHNVMQQLAPPVVIIEEAAEVLEAHVITSLSVNCKHLIMIGDHQQLRPSTTVYELATKYGLDVSLFERMLNNGIPYDTLEYQHRMRPSISRLLVPSIYPELKDHPSVHNFPHINGVSSDVFFVTHEIPEDKGYSENSSHKHTHEAKFIMGLCQHLLRQGYAPQDVTILTPYTGQFLLLRKLQRDKTSCQGVRISVVDNFQGEENKIILLTLVRSNDEGKIGFLRIDNRVCVALSRAKYGFYIIGNMNQLCASSNLWKQVKADLVKEDSLSHALTLKCKNHPHNVIKVSSQEDFAEKSPEGGCWEDCLAVLPNCEHRCPRRCHSDDADHTLHKCNLKCSRVCERNHGCHLRCWEKCLKCTVIVTMLLPCSHSHKLKCHISPLTYVCDSRVEKEKPGCGHKIIIPCHKDPKSAQCTVNCNTKLTCGHECRLICHINNDPNHVRYKCNYNVRKVWFVDTHVQKCVQINVEDVTSSVRKHCHVITRAHRNVLIRVVDVTRHVRRCYSVAIHVLGIVQRNVAGVKISVKSSCHVAISVL
nr:LOW QUALITY PROTEIN: NFX1-type zinc finger-containing protein 1-like [Cherax quadricarinatus]